MNKSFKRQILLKSSVYLKLNTSSFVVYSSRSGVLCYVNWHVPTCGDNKKQIIFTLLKIKILWNYNTDFY